MAAFQTENPVSVILVEVRIMNLELRNIDIITVLCQIIIRMLPV